MKKTIATKVIEQIIIYIVIGILSSFLLTGIFAEKFSVEVLSSIETSENTYTTSIGIKNYQKTNALSDLEIYILDGIKVQ